MIESRISKREAELGLTGGALLRRRALRVVRDGTVKPLDADAPAADPAADPEAGQVRLSASRTFAQHGVLGSPDCLVVRVVVENAGARAAHSDVDVAFDVPGACAACESDAAAGWLGEADGWSFTVSRIGERMAVTLVHRGAIAPGATAEATFRLRMAPDAPHVSGLSLRASGHVGGQDDGWSSDLKVPVERLSF
ncbi:hypothetical protein [Demequina sp. SO4-18]|uniref:hypothetical protein n=1 Tax=Demequina sp. SO4-18 TaxID=3401026 RepID=UPI003B5B548C